MDITNNLPDELLDKIFALFCACDLEGRRVRRLYAVCRRWRNLTSGILYSNIAVCRPQNQNETPSQTEAILRLLDAMDNHDSPVTVKNLLIRTDGLHNNEVTRAILTRVAQKVSHSLLVLAIWVNGPSNVWNSLFGDYYCWPLLQRLIIIGDVEESTLLLSEASHSEDRIPSFPSLSFIHMMGSVALPRIANPTDAPQLRTIRFSHFPFMSTITAVDKIYELVASTKVEGDPFVKQIHQWEILYGHPEGDGGHGTALASVLTSREFRRRMTDIDSMLNEIGDTAPKVIGKQAWYDDVSKFPVTQAVWNQVVNYCSKRLG
ncbi:hypothetical protein DL96DRAFT_1605448 [Flagelloscypha sp. PMI_526]|nr:hypothetical protein DL96DRAFT_1605448 [Flagelloscypha sp. PMI_526]